MFCAPSVDIAFLSQLSVITEEQDKYQTLVNELKKPEKDETGSKVANVNFCNLWFPIIFVPHFHAIATYPDNPPCLYGTGVAVVSCQEGMLYQRNGEQFK